MAKGERPKPRYRKLAQEKVLDRALKVRRKVLEREELAERRRAEPIIAGRVERDWTVTLPSGTVTRLTDAEAAFCQRFLLHGDAERAAREGGYPAGPAAVKRARELLNTQRVRRHLDEESDRRARRYAITSDRIAEEMARIAFANMGDYVRLTDDGEPYFDLRDVDRDAMGVIDTFEVHDYVDGRGRDARDVKKVKLSLYSKLSALETLARKFNLFPARHEVTGEGGGPVRMEDAQRRDLVDKILGLMKPGEKLP